MKVIALEDARDVNFQDLPEQSKRQYYKEFRKVVEASDVILEVLDARDPMGCRARAVESMITAQGDKKIILVLNKIGKEPLSEGDHSLTLFLQISFLGKWSKRG